jgi:hypothetical protein
MFCVAGYAQRHADELNGDVPNYVCRLGPLKTVGSNRPATDTPRKTSDGPNGACGHSQIKGGRTQSLGNVSSQIPLVEIW